MDPRFLELLESYRRALGTPVSLTSAFRSSDYNRRVGGARRSQHLYGRAVDLARTSRRPLAQVRALRLFSGLGVSGGLVLHVDARHLHGPTNYTNGSPERPTIWNY